MTSRVHSRRRVTGRTVLTAAALAVLCLGIILTAGRAMATYRQVIDAGQPGLLTLSVNSETPLWATLKPGQESHWLVRAELSGASAGSLALEFSASGRLVETAGLTAAVTACSGSFAAGSPEGDAPSCSGKPRAVLAETPLRDLTRAHARYALAELHAGSPRELLVTLHLPETATRAEVADAAATVGLGVFAAGDTTPPTTPPPTPPSQPPARPIVQQPGLTTAQPSLATTGADLTALCLVAVGLLGISLALHSRRRQP